MVTLREKAIAYTPTQTLNIADLDSFPVDAEVFEATKEKKNDKGEVETFSYNYVLFNDVEYRIPNSVVEQIQTILSLKPEVQFVRARKTGSGLNTKYKTEAL